MIRRGKREQLQQQLSCPELLVSKSRKWKPHEGCVQVEDDSCMDHYLKKPHFRFPRRSHFVPVSVTPLPEKPTVRRITVDLRPALEQVMNSGEGDWDSSESDSEDPASMSAQNSEQEVQTKYRRSESPPQKRGTGELRIYLPPVVKSHGRHGVIQGETRRVSLVTMTDDGTLTSNTESKHCEPHHVCFPRVILSQEYAYKLPEEQRSARGMPTQWHGVEKLQLPLSEVVKVMRERADSDQHAFITRILCSIREKQEQHALQNMKTKREPSSGHILQSKIYRQKQDQVKLTWVKRS